MIKQSNSNLLYQRSSGNILLSSGLFGKKLDQTIKRLLFQLFSLNDLLKL